MSVAESNRFCDRRVAVLVCAALLLSARTVRAEEFLAVLPILTDDGQTSLSKEPVEEAVARALRYRMTPPLLTGARLESLGPRELARSCGLDVDCLAAPLGRQSVSFAIVARVDLDLTPPLLSIVAIDVKQARELGKHVEILKTPDERTVLLAIERAVGAIFAAAEIPVAGRVSVSCVPSTAVVTWAGDAPIAAELDPTGQVYKQHPGKATLRVSQVGFVEREVEVDVVAGSDKRVTVELEEETALYQSPWFWGGSIAAAAAVGIGIALWAADRDRHFCIEGKEDPCP